MADISEQITSLSPKHLALLAVELQRRVESLERRGHEPVAIVGIGCRFPGGEDGPDAYWHLLSQGADAIREVPPTRWDAAALYDPDPDAPGKATVRHGAFLEDVESFDAVFFGIAPREAAAIDPQQRLLLEVAWEALEHAAIAPSSLSGTTTGVFVGISGSDFQEVAVGDDAPLDAYTASGAAHSVASGRLSYTLGLNGPSISVDTACSSSLVAVHLAVQSLRTGECSLAFAGGVNVMLSPTTTIALSKARMLAPDGRCKTFDARADGFARGEGCGVVVLKRLDDAIADGDRIVAVIRGSAVNQDGRSAGLSAPNGPAQEAVIRAALSDAGLEPHEVGYVEAHGTGTALGDPIEMRALGSALCADRTTPLFVGSAKTNFGHLEAAAGIAGLVKAALALERGEIPPHLHLTERSPHIPWDDFPALDVPTERRAWPEGSGRIAGVSSFGFSGTNAHILLEAAPREQPTEEPAARARLLPLSADDPGALRQLAGLYAARLRGAAPSDVERICRTAAAGRSHHPHRLALVVSSPDGAAEALDSFAAGEGSLGVLEGVAGSARRPGIAFLFTGQGSQYAGMGRELYETEPSFRESIDRCAELLAGRLDRPLLDLLWDVDGELLGETAYAQPALVALEIALADLWASWGIRPAAVAGHSVGELAAACVVGALRLEDALALAAERGRLMQLAPRGAMAAVFASEDRVADAFASLSGRVAIAAVNGAESVTVSGDEQDLHDALARLSAAGIGSKPLAVTRAFHSPLLDPVLGDLQAAATGLLLGEPAALLVSTLTGRPAGRDELADPAYWRRQAREPVRFAQAVDALVASGSTTFVEIGPGATLVGMARRQADTGDDRFSWLPSLRPGDSGRALLESLGALYVRGYEVDWPAVTGGRGAPPAALPTYPFQRRPFPIPWARRRSGTPAASPLLGKRLDLAVDAALFETELHVAALPFLGEHLVHGRAVLPSAAYLELAVGAAADLLGTVPVAVADLAISEPLIVPKDGSRVIQTVAEPGPAGVTVTVASADGARGWRRHARATVAECSPAGLPESLEAACSRVTEELDVDRFYGAFDELGLALGPRFRAVERLWRGEGEAVAVLRLPDELSTEALAYRVHPALLDACVHLLAAALPGLEAPYLLASLDRARVEPAPAGEALIWHGRVRRDTKEPDGLLGDVTVASDSGALVAVLTGIRLKRAPGLGGGRQLLYEVAWREQPRSAGRASTGDEEWVIVGDRGGLGEALAARLSAAGVPSRVVAGADELAGGESVVHLGTLDAVMPQEPTAHELDEVARLGVGSALETAQTLVAGGVRAARLVAVTRGAQPADGPAREPLQAEVWGFLRAAAEEHPELACACIDLDPEASREADLEALVAELCALDGREPSVAFRGMRRLVERLTASPLGSVAPAHADIRPEASYIVTGGLGGLGLAVAGRLVERGARRLVLVGRRVPSPDALQAIDRFATAGAQAVTLQADVSSRADVERIVAEAEQLGPLAGIVHAAGVIDDGILLKQTWERFSRVAAGKVAGAVWLDHATRGRELDFICLFSSGASVLGSAGQTNYAAANAFLDAAASRLRHAGRPAVSVDWGPWATVGAAAARGLHRDTAIQPDEALAAFELAISRDASGDLLAPPRLAVLPLGLPDDRSPSLLEELRPAGRTSAQGPGSARARPRDLAGVLEATAPNRRRRVLEDRVRDEAALVLGLDPTRISDLERPLSELGLDSLMAVELRNRLSEASGRALPPTLLFEYPSVSSLSAFLLHQLDGAAEGPQVEPAAAPESELAELTDSQVAERLAQKLDAIAGSSR